jgi:two-component system chemotaxis sensor kinase CheA
VPDRPEKLADFLSEAQEHIDALGAGLMRLDGAVEPDPDLVNAVFRAAHTLKGLSSISGVERMALLAHALEDVLDGVRMGRRALDGATLDLLLDAPEVFSRIVAEEAGGAPRGTDDAAARLAARLREAASAEAVREDGADPLDAIALGPEIRGVLTEYEEHRLRAAARRGTPVLRLRVVLDLACFDAELGALSARLKPLGEVLSTLPEHGEIAPGQIPFQLLFASAHPAEAVAAAAGAGARVEPVPVRGRPEPGAPAREESPAVPEAAPAGGSLRSLSPAVRVDIRKLDHLMTLVGELALVKSSLLAVAGRVKAEQGDPAMGMELQRASRALERRLDALQAGILEVRLVPLRQLFERLARMVRTVAREVGKEIVFDVSGGEVRVDKLVVDDLADPLVHLLRNAVDHAIEPPEVRARAGKPPAGRVRLAAEQKGRHVRIVVEDDGAGIDGARVREVAVARGVVPAASAGALGDRELTSLLFLPGFSTAREVTALSGRGVGLDVVKTGIAGLSGLIDVRTDAGRGTRFEIVLPVTLAIVRALVVAVARRSYAVPLASVLEVLEVPAAEIRAAGGRDVLTVRGDPLPVVHLGALFGVPAADAPARAFVVVVGIAQERLGIAVDDVAGQHDIVVKPLGAQLRSVRGIAGATDLGDGRTVLVLDVASLVQEVASGAAAGADPA